MIDYKYADLFLKSNIDKQFKITTDVESLSITNKELHQESFELNESICSEKTLKFGTCEASSVKFKVSNIFSPLKDKWIRVSVTLGGGADEPFEFGRYKVYSDKPTADRSYREIVAYDAMCDVLKANVTNWYNGLTFPMSLRTFRNTFVSHFGLQEEEVILPNDDMILSHKSNVVEISGKDVITAICELNGCFGRVKDNTFKYVFLKPMFSGLYPSATLYPSESLYPIESVGTFISKSTYIPPCEYEDYVVQKITGVTIREKENGNTFTVGEGKNLYIIQDNFLVNGKSAAELKPLAENILDKIKDISYRPFGTKAKGNPCLEPGDTVRLSTNTQLIETYILQRTLSGVQSLKDRYIADGEEYYEMKMNSVKQAISNLQTEVSNTSRISTENYNEVKQQITDEAERAKEVEKTLTESVNGIELDITNLATNTSTRFEQTDESIELEATRAQNAEDNLSARLALTATDISLSVKGDETVASIIVSITREDGTEVSKGTIELTGVVTFKGLSTEGETEINGSNITTGTIEAERINIPGIIIGAGGGLPTIDAILVKATKAEFGELSVPTNAITCNSLVGDYAELNSVECDSLLINLGLLEQIDVAEKLAELEARISALE